MPDFFTAAADQPTPELTEAAYLAADIVACLADAMDRAGTDGEALLALQALDHVEPHLLDRLRRALVANARTQGASWAAIGEVLGVTRQAVHIRYGPSAEPARVQ